MSDTVTLPQAVRPPLAKKRPRLYVLYSPQAGIERSAAHSLPDGATVLGRRLPEAHEGIELDADPSVSEVHAQIDVADAKGLVTVRDLGSKNGTWVGSQRLQAGSPPSDLSDGTVLRVGATFLLLRFEPSKSADAAIPALVGRSLAMRELRARLHRLAPESAPVLLVGETGTGKELAAHALHTLSRRTGAFVPRNCGAFPQALIESELFGHASHSFTGSGTKTRQGAFRSADQGTLFLDEIGELPLSQQVQLLRAIEEGKITPVGADAALPCHARVVTATHRDMDGEVAAGRFRADLRARLAHLLVELPPVRARREDILLLLEHSHPDVQRALSVDLVQDLLQSDWRDNVRGLKSVADRLRIEGDSETLRMSLRPRQSPRNEGTPTPAADPAFHAKGASGSQVSPAARPYRLLAPSKADLEELLHKHLGTIANVAKELHCSRRQVQRYLTQHDLDADKFRVPR